MAIGACWVIGSAAAVTAITDCCCHSGYLVPISGLIPLEEARFLSFSKMRNEIRNKQKRNEISFYLARLDLEK